MSPYVEVSAKQAREMVESSPLDSYELVDVRQPWEYEEFRLPGARLVPLPELEERLDEIDGSKPVVVYCRSGKRSASAAGILAGKGFADVRSIVGGAMAWQGAPAEGPETQGLSLLRGDETPLAVLGLAYSMEENLAAFYERRAELAEEKELGDVFRRLSRFEAGHKKRVLKVAQSLSKDVSGPKDLPAEARAASLEAGLTPEEFESRWGGLIDGAVDAVDAAMGLEAQAVDLYLRLRERVESGESAAVLTELAEEERAHLRQLARMMDRLGSG